MSSTAAVARSPHDSRRFPARRLSRSGADAHPATGRNNTVCGRPPRRRLRERDGNLLVDLPKEAGKPLRSCFRTRRRRKYARRTVFQSIERRSALRIIALEHHVHGVRAMALRPLPRGLAGMEPANKPEECPPGARHPPNVEMRPVACHAFQIRNAAPNCQGRVSNLKR